jgi:hypothetical protein
MTTDGRPAAGDRGAPGARSRCTSRDGPRGSSCRARTVWTIRPPRAEATAMAEIAVAAGVPRRHYRRDPLARHDRQHLARQAAAGPALRAARRRGDLALARAARALPGSGDLGPGYQVTVDSLGGQASTRLPGEIARREAGLLATSRRWLAADRPHSNLPGHKWPQGWRNDGREPGAN